MDEVNPRDNLTPQKRRLQRGGRTTIYEPQVARQRFLTALERYGNVSRACRHARISRETAYNWREQEKAFEAAWRLALSDAADRLEEEAWRRAVTGTKKPVYQGGEQVGGIREYSDTLLIFLMKAANPEKYRESIKHEHSGERGGPIRIQYFDATAALAALAAGSGGDSEGA